MDTYHVKLHGGIGDQIWVYKKLCNLDKPLFVTVASEHIHRPRRTGEFLSHLPKVAGWKYDDSPFVPTGDWPEPSHPSCMFDKNWSDIELPTEGPLLIECNKWLEEGRRLEDWLPDLPTNHHFEFKQPSVPKLKLAKPYILFHVCSWPDIPDAGWLRNIRAACNIANVYLVGGTYDGRYNQICKLVNKHKLPVECVSDLSWPDLYTLLSHATYCFGHASGITAICDVLKIPSIVMNPSVLPKLTNTWNSKECEGTIYTGSLAEWQAGVDTALYALKTSPTRGEWQPYIDSSIHDYITTVTTARPVNDVLLVTTSPEFASGFVRAITKRHSPKTIIVIGSEGASKAVRKYLRHIGRKTIVNNYPPKAIPPSFTTYDLVVMDGTISSLLPNVDKKLSSSGVLLYNSKLPPADKFISIDGVPNWFTFSK